MSQLVLNIHKHGIMIGMLLLSCTAWGEDQVINQSEQNNVAGVIQFGPFAAVDIIQIGDYNRTAVVQFGIDPVGTITQQGNHNRAVVFQIPISDTSTIKIFQDGVFNYNSISQDSASPVGSLSQSSLNTLVNNFLFAPETIASQTELTQIKTLSFNTSLLSRLDRSLSKRFTLFGGRNLLEGQHSDRLGAIGFDYNITTSMIGGEMQLTPNMRLGLALQRSKTDGDVNYGLANIDIHSTLVSIFGSVNLQQLFMDFAAAYGNNDYKINRPGFGSPVSSSHEGYDVSLSTRAGYLFKHNSLKFGPVVGLNYIQTNIDSYQELGNVLLTQTVDEQLNEFLIGEVGVQLRYKSHNFSTFTNLTLEHDFTIEEFRVIDSSYSMSPEKKVFIPVSDFKHNNSVRLLSGLDVEIDFGLELSFLVDFRFNNDERDAWMVGTNVNYSF
jgi:uncharacterized protein YhjY with autotransporter beta-barrel domain